MGEFVEALDFRVYSRWGEEVFAATSMNERWNGSLPGGGPAPEGVYVFVLKATALGDRIIEEKGTITLFR
ncbi:MAG: gliding motility-associated C-terminal domain-containing protein [Bacteroidota bacterium]